MNSIQLRPAVGQDLPALSHIEREAATLFPASVLPPHLAMPLPLEALEACLAASGEYVRQKKFDGCVGIRYKLPFDFYLPKYRTAIEFDGKQHYEPMEFFGGLEAYNRLKANDKIKSDYCEDNYIDLIRIRYDQIDRVFEILKESLKNKI